MIERLEFAEVPVAWIEARKVKLAGLVCSRVSRELRLSGVKVRWLHTVHELGYSAPKDMRFWSADDFGGMVRSNWPGTIFLRATLNLPEVVEVVAHEARHLWQAELHGDWARWWKDCMGPRDRADQEADAIAFARRFKKDIGW